MSRGEGGKLTKVHRERQWQNQHLAHKYTVFLFCFQPCFQDFPQIFQSISEGGVEADIYYTDAKKAGRNNKQIKKQQ